MAVVELHDARQQENCKAKAEGVRYMFSGNVYGRTSNLSADK